MTAKKQAKTTIIEKERLETKILGLLLNVENLMPTDPVEGVLFFHIAVELYQDLGFNKVIENKLETINSIYATSIDSNRDVRYSINTKY